LDHDLYNVSIIFVGFLSAFGQSTTGAFGSQSPFGQSNVTNNPFAPKPFGAANPFGSQTGSSIFGNTSTGVFGQSSSPLSSTPVFGASSPGFGSSTPAFGTSSSSFGGKFVVKLFHFWCLVFGFIFNLRSRSEKKGKKERLTSGMNELIKEKKVE